MAARIWISWNKQRRNIGLADALGAKLCMSELDLPRWRRTPMQLLRSWRLIRAEKPAICFTMNPSIFSSWWLSLLARWYHFLLITDLHTVNVKTSGVRLIIFNLFFRSGLKRSDIVIVTNSMYRSSILRLNPSVVCIPDPLPRIHYGLTHNTHMGTDNKFSVLFISSFAEDEPLSAVLALDSCLDEFTILVTGNWKLRFENRPKTQNILFLGFLPDAEYDSLLCSVDSVMVLTFQEDCLCCGAYEAFSAGKPLVLSGTEALRSFFGQAPVYTDNTSESILESLLTIKREKDLRTQMIISGRAALQDSFCRGISELESRISKIETRRAPR